MEEDRVKSEETETKLRLPKCLPALPVHFEELNRIWPANPRIPSAISRRAWALARGLNPSNVNNWWYRRRKVAKKLRITIPIDTYELDIGEPPDITPLVVKEELREDFLSEPYASSVDAHTIEEEMFASSDTHIPSSDDGRTTTLATSSPIPSENMNMRIKSDEIDAYMQATDACLVISGAAAGSVHSSSGTLPPQPLSSQSPSPSLALFLGSNFSFEEKEFSSEHCIISDTRTDRDALWTSFRLLEDFYPGYVLPTVDSGVPLSSCVAQPFWKVSWPSGTRVTVEDAQSRHDAPWCLAGFRVHIDGSLAGICSCFNCS